MDTRLRELERLASCGDARALAALGVERLRLGLGWHGEALPARVSVRRGEPGVYVFHGPERLRLTLTYLPRAHAWISRGPVPAFHARKLLGTAECVGPARLVFDEAQALCWRLGVWLPTVAQWLEAGFAEDAECWRWDEDRIVPDRNHRPVWHRHQRVSDPPLPRRCAFHAVLSAS